MAYAAGTQREVRGNGRRRGRGRTCRARGAC